jgi:hypothetical protein
MGEVHEDFLAPRPPDPVAPSGGGRRDPDAEADAKPEKLVTVRVADGTQFGHEGVVYGGGATVTAPASLAESWVAYGWATRVASTRPAPAKAVTRRK